MLVLAPAQSIDLPPAAASALTNPSPNPSPSPPNRSLTAQHEHLAEKPISPTPTQIKTYNYTLIQRRSEVSAYPQPCLPSSLRSQALKKRGPATWAQRDRESRKSAIRFGKLDACLASAPDVLDLMRRDRVVFDSCSPRFASETDPFSSSVRGGLIYSPAPPHGFHPRSKGQRPRLQWALAYCYETAAEALSATRRDVVFSRIVSLTRPSASPHCHIAALLHRCTAESANRLTSAGGELFELSNSRSARRRLAKRRCRRSAQAQVQVQKPPQRQPHDFSSPGDKNDARTQLTPSLPAAGASLGGLDHHHGPKAPPFRFGILVIYTIVQ